MLIWGPDSSKSQYDPSLSIVFCCFGYELWLGHGGAGDSCSSLHTLLRLKKNCFGKAVVDATTAVPVTFILVIWMTNIKSIKLHLYLNCFY